MATMTKLPAGFRLSAKSDGPHFAVIADEERSKFYAAQFHPEVAHAARHATVQKFHA